MLNADSFVRHFFPNARGEGVFVLLAVGIGTTSHPTAQHLHSWRIALSTLMEGSSFCANGG